MFPENQSSERKLMKEEEKQKEEKKKDQKIEKFTNRVLLQIPTKDENKFILYLPCYLRVDIESFTELSKENLNAKLKLEIKFDIDVTGLQQQITDLIKRDLSLSFQHEGIIQINTDDQEISLKIRQKKGRTLYGYRIRKILTVGMIPDIFWTPFQFLYLVLSITVQHIELWEKEELEKYEEILKKGLTREQRDKVYDSDTGVSVVAIKFNIMDFGFPTQYLEKDKDGIDVIKDATARISFRDGSFFGNYDLAERKFKVEYTKEGKPQLLRQQTKSQNNQGTWLYKKIVQFFYPLEINYQLPPEQKGENLQSVKKKHKEKVDEILKKNKKSEDRKISPFRHAHFLIPLYKQPFVAIFTIFMPNWFLGWINLAVFFQDFNLADRVASIATVMLAYISFMPVFRGELPPSPSIAFIEMMVYLEIVVTVLSLIESISRRQEKEDFIWYESGLFMCSLAIHIIFTFSILILTLIYLFKRLPTYNIEQGYEVLLDPNEWWNKKCDEMFKKKIAQNKFQIFEYGPQKD